MGDSSPSLSVTLTPDGDERRGADAAAPDAVRRSTRPRTGDLVGRARRGPMPSSVERRDGERRQPARSRDIGARRRSPSRACWTQDQLRRASTDRDGPCRFLRSPMSTRRGRASPRSAMPARRERAADALERPAGSDDLASRRPASGRTAIRAIPVRPVGSRPRYRLAIEREANELARATRSCASSRRRCSVDSWRRTPRVGGLQDLSARLHLAAARADSVVDALGDVKADAAATALQVDGKRFGSM